jgi:biotin carboxylase
MKKLLVVGAGKGQLPIIKFAKELGIWVLSVDRDLNAPGASISDQFECIDIIDKEAILIFSKNNNIDGIMTYQSDIGVPTVGYVSDKLNLSNVSFETAELASNKILSRKRFAKFGVSQPKFSITSDLNETEKACDYIGYPCVVKAADSSGSRGVTIVKNRSEIAKAYKDAKEVSRIREILVEEFINGYEIGAQAFSRKGQQTIVFLHNDTFQVENCLVPTGHSMPIKTLDKNIQPIVQKEIINALLALNITTGPANVDLIIKDNKAYIIEIGARAGATCLPELVFHHSQINWEKISIESSIGLVPELKVLSTRPIAVSILYSNSNGYFDGYQIDESKFNKLQVLDFEIEIDKGVWVNKLSKGTDRIGKVICSGSSVIEAENNVIEFIKSFTVKIKNEA